MLCGVVNISVQSKHPKMLYSSGIRALCHNIFLHNYLKECPNVRMCLKFCLMLWNKNKNRFLPFFTSDCWKALTLETPSTKCYLNISLEKLHCVNYYISFVK